MDHDLRRPGGSPDPAPVRAREFAGLDDWLADEALELAVTAEEELAVGWSRHCARLREDQHRREASRSATGGGRRRRSDTG